MLADFAQNTLDGVMLGSAYALLALGFTLIFGVLRRANLAYGPAIMLGAYAATWVNLSFRPGLFILALVTIAGATLAGAYVSQAQRKRLWRHVEAGPPFPHGGVVRAPCDGSTLRRRAPQLVSCARGRPRARQSRATRSAAEIRGCDPRCR
jgi:hypothetical protein